VLPIPILLYHRISSDEGAGTTSPEDFRAHLEWLSETGVSSLSCAEFESVIEGRTRTSNNQILITFDDGYREVHDFALPLMKRYGAVGMMFVITGRVRDGSVLQANATELYRYLSLAEIRSIQESAVLEVHSHTNNHENWVDRTPLSDDALNALREDLIQSRDFLSASLRLPATYFRHLAWPWGSTNSQLINVAKYVGFSYQYLVQFAAANRIGATERLPRLCCDGMPIGKFKQMVKMLMNSRTVLYVNAFSRGYRRLRGNVSY
jgi:peptidoglycan/xylan/chitin deacetylase (PgdA/CDA1 family)